MEFDKEIQGLSDQFRNKISTLRKDYMDLKLFQNDDDIARARGKLQKFVLKLMEDIKYQQDKLKHDHSKNTKVMKKIEKRMDQIEISRLNDGSDDSQDY